MLCGCQILSTATEHPLITCLCKFRKQALVLLFNSCHSINKSRQFCHLLIGHNHTILLQTFCLLQQRTQNRILCKKISWTNREVKNHIFLLTVHPKSLTLIIYNNARSQLVDGQLQIKISENRLSGGGTGGCQGSQGTGRSQWKFRVSGSQERKKPKRKQNPLSWKNGQDSKSHQGSFQGWWGRTE